MDNNNCFIPPGESRVITIKARRDSPIGLTLGQTGWTITCWNADDVVVPSSDDVVLSVGRWDKLCREFVGANRWGGLHLVVGDSVVAFGFEASRKQAGKKARLMVHSADQSKEKSAVLVATLNGRTLERELPLGLGIQRTNAEHLAFPVTVEFELEKGDLRKGSNTLTLGVKGAGWFTLDAVDLINR